MHRMFGRALCSDERSGKLYRLRCWSVRNRRIIGLQRLRYREIRGRERQHRLHAVRAGDRRERQRQPCLLTVLGRPPRHRRRSALRGLHQRDRTGHDGEHLRGVR